MNEDSMREFITKMKKELLIPASYFYKDEIIEIHRSDFHFWINKERPLSKRKLNVIENNCKKLKMTIKHLSKEL